MRLLLFISLHAATLLLSSAAADDVQHSLRFDLIPHSDPLRADRLSEILRVDLRRQRAISAVVGRRRRTCESNLSFALPIGAGAYAGAGQYFVRFKVGTPAQKFVLIADTGSDLTWMRCRRRRGGVSRRRREFDAGKSSSFRPIGCSSEMCKNSLPFSLTTCPTPTTPCAYDYGYSDGSSAQGIFANESATVARSDGRKIKLHSIIIGCTSTTSGSSFRGADGVLGLGYSAASFTARATDSYGGRFSYCLVDHLSPRNASSYLTFGPNPALGPAARSTPLILQPRLEPFYFVGVEGISIAGEVLRIPRSVWNASRGGGAILDSGTSLMVLAEPAYRAVVEALSRGLSRVPRVKVDGFEYCYNWTAGGAGVEPPKLTVHFVGSARLQPPSKSYVIDVADGVKCIGVTSGTWPGVSTLGNIIQQQHLWEFDIQNRRLRFQTSTCLSK